MVLKKNTRKIKTRNKNKRKSNIIKTRINLHKKYRITNNNKKKRYITKYTKKHYNLHGGDIWNPSTWFTNSKDSESSKSTGVNSPSSTFSKFTDFFNFNRNPTTSSANTITPTQILPQETNTQSSISSPYLDQTLK